MQRKLKLCPLCSGEAEYRDIPADYPTTRLRLSAQCTECGLELFRICPVEYKKRTEEELFESWNRRA